MNCLLIDRRDFGANVICLGSQVAAVIEALAVLPDVGRCAWYAASIDVTGSPVIREAFRVYEGREPVLIERLSEFLTMAKGDIQFLDAMFFAIPSDQKPDVVGALTADGPIEKLVRNAIVQVCAHDTSVIDIIAEAPFIITHLQDRFGGKIAQSADFA